MTSINKLPLESFHNILQLTDGVTLARSRRVCKEWKDKIDGSDCLWQIMCQKEFKYPSRIAKRKCGSDCSWYHIYRNLKSWEKVSSFERNIREFYNFSLHDKAHALDIDSSILPLKDTRGVVLYDMASLKYIPAVIPEKSCRKLSNNEFATVIQLKSSILLQRTVENTQHMAEAFFKGDDFILTTNTLYFYNNRDIYKCNLLLPVLSSCLIHHCDYDIKAMQFNDNYLYLFTYCGKIVTINSSKNVHVNPISIPLEWIKQIKHICSEDNHNFVCYSRNLFKIETDKYKHLYLDFPPITALFFYGDTVLIGTKAGEILLYRLSSQKRATQPIFEKLAVLPDGKFAVKLDVYERKSGPLIVAATFFEIMLLEINFFPQELADTPKRNFPVDKLKLYKRLLRLKDRLQMN